MQSIVVCMNVCVCVRDFVRVWFEDFFRLILACEITYTTSSHCVRPTNISEIIVSFRAGDFNEYYEGTSFRKQKGILNFKI